MTIDKKMLLKKIRDREDYLEGLKEKYSHDKELTDYYIGALNELKNLKYGINLGDYDAK